MCLALRLEDLERLAEQPGGGVHVGGVVGEPAGPVEQPRPLTGIVGQSCGLRKVALCLAGGRERLGALAGAEQRLARLLAHFLGVGRVGRRLVRVEVVRGDHLGDLVVVGECLVQVFRGCEMACPPLAFRQRLVCDVANEVLQEAVLAVLRRAGVGLEAEHLLADERGEQRLELVGRATGDGGEPVAGERLASTAPS